MCEEGRIILRPKVMSTAPSDAGAGGSYMFSVHHRGSAMAGRSVRGSSAGGRLRTGDTDSTRILAHRLATICNVKNKRGGAVEQSFTCSSEDEGVIDHSCGLLMPK